MVLSYSSCFHELNYNEMQMVDGGDIIKFFNGIADIAGGIAIIASVVPGAQPVAVAGGVIYTGVKLGLWIYDTFYPNK